MSKTSVRAATVATAAPTATPTSADTGSRAARPLRVGLIGYGYWGPHYARILANELDSACLAAAADADSPRRAQAVQRHQELPMFASVEDLLDSGLTDALIVATPASTHRAITEAALGADQHVLVEKPMALTAADAETMAAQASEAERVLMVAHTFLFNPAVRHISKLIETGRLGEILHIHSQRTGLGPVRSDVSVLWDLAPHDLALFHAWVPAEPVEISASGQAFLQSGVDDVAVLTLRFANGIFAAIHASWIDPVKTRRTTVVGRRAMAVFDDTQTVDKLRIYDNAATYQPDGPGFGEFAASVRAGDVHIPRLEPREPLKDQVAHFVECVQQGATPLSDSRQGLYVAKILEAAESQLAGNRA